MNKQSNIFHNSELINRVLAQDVIKMEDGYFNEVNIDEDVHSSKPELDKSEVENFNKIDNTRKIFFLFREQNVRQNKRPKYKMHSIEVKRKCLELAQFMPLKDISHSFDVSIKSLKRWIMVGPERKKGGGRKVRDPEMEQNLYKWYIETFIVNQIPVTSKMIKEKALELTRLPDFAASKGWLEKIKKKYSLQINRSSSTMDK